MNFPTHVIAPRTVISFKRPLVDTEFDIHSTQDLTAPPVCPPLYNKPYF